MNEICVAAGVLAPGGVVHGCRHIHVRLATSGQLASKEEEVRVDGKDLACAMHGCTACIGRSWTCAVPASPDLCRTVTWSAGDDSWQVHVSRTWPSCACCVPQVASKPAHPGNFPLVCHGIARGYRLEVWYRLDGIATRISCVCAVQRDLHTTGLQIVTSHRQLWVGQASLCHTHKPHITRACLHCTVTQRISRARLGFCGLCGKRIAQLWGRCDGPQVECTACGDRCPL
jgi:hypothetical protein